MQILKPIPPVNFELHVSLSPSQVRERVAAVLPSFWRFHVHGGYKQTTYLGTMTQHGFRTYKSSHLEFSPRSAKLNASVEATSQGSRIRISISKQPIFWWVATALALILGWSRMLYELMIHRPDSAAISVAISATFILFLAGNVFSFNESMRVSIKPLEVWVRNLFQDALIESVASNPSSGTAPFEPAQRERA